MISIDGWLLILALINCLIISVAGNYNDHPLARKVRDICGVCGLLIITVVVTRMILQ